MKIKDPLNHFLLGEDYKEISKLYNSKGRYYHNLEHIKNMLRHTPDSGISWELYYAILLHDVIYEVGATDNEEKSAEFAKKYVSPKFKMGDINVDRVCNLIMLTKDHQPHILDVEKNEPDYFWMVYLDLKALIHCNFNEMKKNDEKLFKEYQKTPLHKYKEGRILFLESFYTKFEAYIKDERGFLNYIELLKHQNFNVGVFCGSFNPMHVGHLNIVQQAEKVFDKVIVAASQNPEKENNQMVEPNIENEFITYNNVFELFKTLKENNPNDKFTLIRGLRNGWDLQQEDSFREWVKELSKNEINISYFFCDRAYEFVSSSMLKNISKFGADISKYLV